MFTKCFCLNSTPETFANRQTCWEFKPFLNGHVDDRSFGAIPDVWAIQPSPEPTPFKDGKHTTVMPHSGIYWAFSFMSIIIKIRI